MMAHRMRRIVEHAKHKGAYQQNEDHEEWQESKPLKHARSYRKGVTCSIHPTAVVRQTTTKKSHFVR
jgi:hypothetical protein